MPGAWWNTVTWERKQLIKRKELWYRFYGFFYLNCQKEIVAYQQYKTWTFCVVIPITQKTGPFIIVVVIICLSFKCQNEKCTFTFSTIITPNSSLDTHLISIKNLTSKKLCYTIIPYANAMFLFIQFFFAFSLGSLCRNGLKLIYWIRGYTFLSFDNTSSKSQTQLAKHSFLFTRARDRNPYNIPDCHMYTTHNKLFLGARISCTLISIEQN